MPRGEQKRRDRRTARRLELVLRALAEHERSHTWEPTLGELFAPSQAYSPSTLRASVYELGQIGLVTAERRGGNPLTVKLTAKGRDLIAWADAAPLARVG